MTLTALSLNCRPASIYSNTVFVDFQRPCFWIAGIEAPSRAASVAKPRLKEWALTWSAFAIIASLATCFTMRLMCLEQIASFKIVPILDSWRKIGPSNWEDAFRQSISALTGQRWSSPNGIMQSSPCPVWSVFDLISLMTIPFCLLYTSPSPRD